MIAFVAALVHYSSIFPSNYCLTSLDLISSQFSMLSLPPPPTHTHGMSTGYLYSTLLGFHPSDWVFKFLRYSLASTIVWEFGTGRRRKLTNKILIFKSVVKPCKTSSCLGTNVLFAFDDNFCSLFGISKNNLNPDS